MQKFTNIIIGFGKGGKTLAKTLAVNGQDVLVIEKSAQMYGGTCINIGCIPSKSLITQAEKHIPFAQAVINRGNLTEKLRNKNYHNIADEENATVWTGTARFISDHVLSVDLADGTTEEVEGERIFINTGATPIIPPIPGLKESADVVDSTGVMELPELPEELVIIGAGNIGLEFASMFKNYGSKVTVIDGADQILGREDAEVAAMIYEDLQAEGITFHLNSKVEAVEDGEQGVSVRFSKDGASQTVHADKILVATGRKANTADLGLENTGIKLGDRGEVMVDKFLRTSVENVWAIGDVKGGLQFTYISLDDFRILKGQLLGEGERSTDNRYHVPYSIFIEPALSAVGMTEAQAVEAGYQVNVFKQPMAAVPKANVLLQPKGMMKIVVDDVTSHILGAAIYGAESYETINLVTLAMNAQLPYTFLANQIYTHPTMSEAFNDVLK